MILSFSLKNEQLPDLLNNQRLKHICVSPCFPLCVYVCVCVAYVCDYTCMCICKCVEINLRCSSSAIHFIF